MHLSDFQELLDREQRMIADGMAQVLAVFPPDYTCNVGKHEAVNYKRLEGVVAEALTHCPKAAETIYWLLWHKQLAAQRIKLLADDIRIPD